MEEEKKTPEREEEQALPVQELPTDIPAEVRQKLAEDLNEQATEDLKQDVREAEKEEANDEEVKANPEMLTKSRLLKLLVKKQYVKLREVTEEEQPADLAELLEELDENNRLVVFRLLKKDVATEAFAYMSDDPIWTNTGEIQPEGMGFCEFNGDSFLVLPPNASYGNSTIQAKNPLIILVEEPVKTLKVSSFLLPMSSSGNIVFKNEAVLRSVLNESPLMEKISSIDSFTEGALKYAQLFKQESFYYFAACALCLVSMGAAGIMSAQLWIGENRKRIFTLHTAGIKYSAIILPVLRKEVIVAVCTVLVGGIVVYSIRHPEPLLLLLSSAVLFLMYVLLNFVGYIFFSKREFLQMSFRRE